MKKNFHNKKNRPSRQWLIDKSVNQHLSIIKIASELGIGETTLSRWFKDYGIPKRKSSEIQLPQGFVEQTKEELYRLYVEEHKPVTEIAKFLGVSWGYVQRSLRKYNIQLRSHDKSIRPKNFIKPSTEELHKWIHEEGKTVNQIAKEKGVSNTLIRNYMKEGGVFAKKRVLNRILWGSWTKDQVIIEIKKIKDENGDLSANYCMRKRSSLFHAGHKLFGGWKNAIIAAEIDYSTIIKQKKRTDQEILNEILELKEEGIDLSHKNIKKIRPDLIKGTENNFGSYANAVNSVGIDYYREVAINKNKYWTKERIIDMIKRLDSECHPLNSQAMQKSEYRDLFYAGKIKFCSWGNAVHVAGFDYNKIKTILYKYKCLDGKNVRSIPEMELANWLIKNNLRYEYEPRISDKRKFRADFKVGNYYIEVLGYAAYKGERGENYKKIFQEKILVFQQEHKAGTIDCFGEEVDLYKSYFNNSSRILIKLIPKNNSLKEKQLTQQLGFLIPLFSKSQKKTFSK